MRNKTILDRIEKCKHRAALWNAKADALVHQSAETANRRAAVWREKAVQAVNRPSNGVPGPVRAAFWNDKADWIIKHAIIEADRQANIWRKRAVALIDEAEMLEGNEFCKAQGIQ